MKDLEAQARELALRLVHSSSIHWARMMEAALRAAYDAGLKADPVARQLVAAETYAEELELLLRRCLDVLPVSGQLYSDIADAINGPEGPERGPAISALRSPAEKEGVKP